MAMLAWVFNLMTKFMLFEYHVVLKCRGSRHKLSLKAVGNPNTAKLDL